MIRRSTTSTLWCMVLLAVTTTANDDIRKPKCGIYLAPSSIPGSGLGMYVGDRNIQEDETVTLGDVAIPIIDFEWHNGNNYKDNFLWDEYTWNSNVFPPMEDETSGQYECQVASPGVGAAANSYLTLQNVEDSWIKFSRVVEWDSPGTGAYSLYHGREFLATQPIPPGTEIFVSYGEHYFASRSNTYGFIPLPNDYEIADKMLIKFSKIRQSIENRYHRNRQDVMADFYYTGQSFASIWKESRILNAFPPDFTKLDLIMEEGGTARQHFNQSRKELSWLEEHGQCMDNIRPGDSKNPHAGRGAFATRFIPEGGLVAPAPLIHVGSYDYFRMWEGRLTKQRTVVPNKDGNFTYQLLMNYCFGHFESTLLLCPYGLLTALINHSHENPNTKIQWNKEMRHPDWKDKSIDEWKEEYHTGLAIDFVALRDIDEDEEILIDYGTEWEEAWQEHVKNYIPRTDGVRYKNSFELNDLDGIEFRTHDDRPYELDGVELWCHGWYLMQASSEYSDGKDARCRILQKLDHDNYMVQVYYLGDDRGVTSIELNYPIFSLPRDALFFADIPYKRDPHLLNSFRHWMGIPDDIFPNAWMNKLAKDL